MFAPFVIELVGVLRASLVGVLRASLVGVLRASDCFVAPWRPF